MAYKLRQVKPIGSIFKRENQLIILWNGSLRNYGRTEKAVEMFKSRAKASGFSDKEIDSAVTYFKFKSKKKVSEDGI